MENWEIEREKVRREIRRQNKLSPVSLEEKSRQVQESLADDVPTQPRTTSPRAMAVREKR